MSTEVATQTKEQRHELQLQRKNEMVSNAENTGNVSSLDLRICKAGLSDQIKNIPQQDMISKTSSLATGICMDYGLRNPDQFELTRFFQCITEDYGHLTISEVALAFRLNLTGHLDDFLPKDKNKQPDGNPYGKFNMAFYAKVINAFMKRKNNSWGELYKILPPARYLLPPDSKTLEENRQTYLHDLAQVFKDHRAGKPSKFYLWNQFTIDQLTSFGVKVPEYEEVKEEAEAKAYNLILAGKTRLHGLDVAKVKKKWDGGQIHEILGKNAYYMGLEMRIRKAFDLLIKENKELCLTPL